MPEIKTTLSYGAIQALRNAVRGGRVSYFLGKALRSCKVQFNKLYEKVGGCQISRKKASRNT